MKFRFLAVVGFLVAVEVFASAVRADDYAIDASHSSVTFKISHLGISWIHGRFNDVAGTFTIGADKPSFALTIKAESIDTGIAKRDGHLKSPDFFNVKQFPLITFKSTSVKSMDGEHQVAGDLTMHGVTKPVTMKLTGGNKTVEFPKGVKRVGFTTSLVLKRSDFGIDRFEGAVGGDVHIDISFEGVKK